jgi:syntaxin 8
MSLVKLTSLSTQTLSLLLERQRLQSISQFQSPTAQQRTSNLHLPQIIRNLNQLRTGILELEAKNGASSAEAAGLLRNQYGRMIGMLGSDAESLGIER